MNKRMSCGSIAILAASILLTAGCASTGPGALARDRLNYTTAISDTWKKQMLINMVMIRYGDSPVFLDVSSIVSQSSVETTLDANFSWGVSLGGDSQSVGGSTKYIDRPTITYSPLTGAKFAQNLMTPIPIPSVLNLINSGYSVENVFRLFLNSINGVQNSHGGFSRRRAADPEFYVLVENLGRMQRSNSVGMRVQRKDERDVVLFWLHPPDDEEVLKDMQDARAILGLNPNAQEFEVLFGSVPKDDFEIAILTRSMLEILIGLASSIDVPEIHIADNRVNPTFHEEDGKGNPVRPMVQIFSSREKPTDAFVSVPYKGFFFWIDDKDLPSKKLLSFLMFVFTLTEKGESTGAPIITIPAG